MRGWQEGIPIYQIAFATLTSRLCSQYISDFINRIFMRKEEKKEIKEKKKKEILGRDKGRRRWESEDTKGSSCTGSLN